MIDLPPTVDPDDALAQPTRARLFALLGELKRPVGTAELSERLALHPNGVRLHLERLEAAGLVQRARVRHGRGRPPDLWTISPDARPGGDPPNAYVDLARWLARALGGQARGLRAIEDTGREIGHELAPAVSTDTAEGLTTALTALGFQPAVTDRDDGRIEICLRNCPYREAVRQNQPAVCALHRGITSGVLDVLEPAAELIRFVPKDPDQANCLITVMGAEPGGPAAGAARPLRRRPSVRRR